MKASALMFELRQIINKHGDLPIVGGFLSHDSGLEHVVLVDENGINCETDNTKPYGIILR